MKIKEFVDNYNFHDCRINELKYDIKSKEFLFKLFPSVYFDEKYENKEYIIIKFLKVVDVKTLLQIESVDEYLLNIWKVKGQKNMVEIIFDDENNSVIYVNALEVEII